MFTPELKNYFDENEIEPTLLMVRSRSAGKEEVPCCYIKHDITGDRYKELSELIRGTLTSCSLDMRTILLVPSSDLGPKISLLDAVESASQHMNGKKNERVRVVTSFDSEEPEAAPVKKAVVKKAVAKKAPAKKKVAKKPS